MKKISVILSLILTVCLLMTACNSRGVSKDNNQEGYSANTNAENKSTADGSANGLSSSGFTETSNGNVDTRKLIKDVSMSIQTKSYDDFMTNLSTSIKNCGGYVQSSKSTGNSYDSSSDRNANVVARIPADKLDGFLNQVSSLGNVTDKTENVQDVTADYVDVQSRIAALKTEQESLMKLMTNATNMDDILQIEDRLTQVNTDLESYESKQRTYDNLVAYSTVTMNIAEVERITPVKKLTMWQEIGGNLTNNLKDIGGGFRAIFIWFVSASPYLLLITVIVFAVLWIVRAATKKSRRDRQQRPYQSPIIPPTNENLPGV